MAGPIVVLRREASFMLTQAGDYFIWMQLLIIKQWVLRFQDRQNKYETCIFFQQIIPG
jgi:hypothetical protein